MKAAAVAARIAISAAYGAADNDVQIFDLIFDWEYHNLFFLRGGKFAVALQAEYCFHAFICKNILYVADMQNMVIRIHGLTDACYNGKASIFGNFNIRAGEFLHGNAKFFDLIGIPSRRGTAGDECVRKRNAGNRNNYFFTFFKKFQRIGPLFSENTTFPGLVEAYVQKASVAMFVFPSAFFEQIKVIGLEEVKTGACAILISFITLSPEIILYHIVQIYNTIWNQSCQLYLLFFLKFYILTLHPNYTQTELYIIKVSKHNAQRVKK